MDNQTSNNKIFIYLLVVFFAVFVGSGLFLVMSNKKNATNEPAATTSAIPTKEVIIPTVEMSKGYINLKNDLVLNKLNSPANLTIVADSNSENITAFDTLVVFDPTAFDFVSAQSVDPNFKVYPYVKDNGLTLTVVKTGPSTVPSVFNNTQIVSLIFQPKKTGQFIFRVVPSVGKETTKFVNDQTKIIYPAVNEIKVTVN